MIVFAREEKRREEKRRDKEEYRPQPPVRKKSPAKVQNVVAAER
jgi:hypothetical protein